ncbi:hypothetical protein EV363DRAFT_1529668 [Boletus edulis]|nr:hypothetical protein EV363DRAFT_1529668 [Boletus edulis]
MAPLKRKRSMENDPESFPVDDQDIDIASALTGTRPAHLPSDEDTGDEDLDEFLHDAIAKRDVKGLHPHLLRALTIQGYRTPTPIQRVTIPSLLATPPRDLVARELALQVLRVGKSLARGWKSEGAPHAGDGHDVDDDNSKLGSGNASGGV